MLQVLRRLTTSRSRIPVQDIERRDPAAGQRLQRHRFTEAQRTQIRPLLVTDDWHGLLEVVEDWTVIGLAIAGSEWSRAHLPRAAWGVVYFLALLVIGLRQRGLADLLHQATHRTLARRRWLNFVLGTFASGYCVLQSFTSYRYTHIARHHTFLGEAGADPDYQGILEAGIYGTGMNAATVRRYMLRLVHPVTTFRYLAYVWRNRIFNVHETSEERVLRGIFFSLVAVAAIATGTWPLVLAYWFVPLLTTANWVGCVIELMEHYPLLETRPRVDVLLSQNRICSWPVRFFIGVHSENYHLVHHIFPAMPNWNFAAAHRILLADPLYAHLHKNPGIMPILRMIMNPEKPDELVETIEDLIPPSSAKRLRGIPSLGAQGNTARAAEEG